MDLTSVALHDCRDEVSVVANILRRCFDLVGPGAGPLGRRVDPKDHVNATSLRHVDDPIVGRPRAFSGNGAIFVKAFVRALDVVPDELLLDEMESGVPNEIEAARDTFRLDLLVQKNVHGVRRQVGVIDWCQIVCLHRWRGDQRIDGEDLILDVDAEQIGNVVPLGPFRFVRGKQGDAKDENRRDAKSNGSTACFTHCRRSLE